MIWKEKNFVAGKKKQCMDDFFLLHGISRKYLFHRACLFLIFITKEWCFLWTGFDKVVSRLNSPDVVDLSPSEHEVIEITKLGKCGKKLRL